MAIEDGGPAREMTKREAFAMAALNGLLSGQYRDTGRYNFSEAVTEAVGIADSLLAALRAQTAGRAALGGNHG